MASDQRDEREPEGPDGRERGAWYTAAALLALMLAASAWGYLHIPPGARVAIHWDAAGRANGFGPRWQLLLISPAIALASLGLLAAIRKARAATAARALGATAAASTAVLAAVHVLAVLAAAGQSVDVTRGAVLGQALLLLVVGNYLPTTRRNAWVGVRTPWTLRSDEAWRRTHALGGRLFVAHGALVLGAAVVSLPLANAVLIGGLIALVVTLSFYSYRVAREAR